MQIIKIVTNIREIALALYGTNTEHGFNALLLDTDAHSLLGYKFIYNQVIYKPTKVIDNRNVMFNTNNHFRFTPEFQKELLTDSNEREGEIFSKYFVFPSLEPKSTNLDSKNFTVTTEEKFKDLLSCKNKISIEGSSRTGKSTLAKYLTNQLSEEYTVLMLNEDSFAPKSTKNIIKYALHNEFGDDSDVDEFLQLNKENKVLIIDGREENDIDEILISLDYVAHYIHFIKHYQKISYKEFFDAVNEYKNRYDNNELNIKYVYDVAIKSNILKESSTSFEVEFCDENLLAYFVAQHLNRTCQMGENPNDLKEVLDNICFGINGDVILFLSYITSNTQILNPILQSIFTHMNDWEELDIDKNNIQYLSKATTTTTPKLPNKKDKEKIKQEKNKMEREIIEEKEHQADSLYSYDPSKINTFSNKITKSINYLDLVAKILPNFRFMLKGDEKKIITSILYTYPNKLLYFMLKDIDTNYNKIIEDILKSKPKTRKGILITEDMLTHELQNQSIAYILSIYDFVSMTASTTKTISDLEKFDFNQNTNYKIQNLMMQENIANFKTFAARAEQLYDQTDLPLIKQMVSLIVRKYFIYHDVEMHGDAIHLIDKFFGKEQRKHFQIMQAKNLIIKK